MAVPDATFSGKRSPRPPISSFFILVIFLYNLVSHLHTSTAGRAGGGHLLIGLIVFLLLPGAFLDATAQAQDPAESRLARAEATYRAGDFEAAIDLLQRIDKQQLPTDEAVEAYHLLALCYFHEGNLAGAQAALANLLQVAPDYRPNPVQEPPSQRFSHSYLRLVQRLRGAPEPMRIAAPEPMRMVYAERLQEAEAARLEGEPDEAVKMAREYLRRDSLDVVERVQAYRTQGLAYAAKGGGSRKKAREAATELIVRYPQYELSEEEKEQFPEFAALVEEARERHESGEINRSIRRRKRLKQLAFTALGTAAAIFIVQLGVRDFTSR